MQSSVEQPESSGVQEKSLVVELRVESCLQLIVSIKR
jgi:hypothetical protein